MPIPSRALAAAAVALSACSGEPRAEPARTAAADSPAARAAPADPAQVATRRLALLDSLERAHPERVRTFAKVPERAGLVAVRDSLSWPDEVETSVNLWTDERGRPVALLEAPFSDSGDTASDFIHVFDEQGSTVAVRSSAAWFVSGCVEIMRMEERRLYGPGLALLRADSTFTDGDDQPMQLTEECFVPDFSMEVLEGYDALVRAGRAPALSPS